MCVVVGGCRRVMWVGRHGSNALRVVYVSFSPHLSKLKVDSWRMYAHCPKMEFLWDIRYINTVRYNYQLIFKGTFKQSCYFISANFQSMETQLPHSPVCVCVM